MKNTALKTAGVIFLAVSLMHLLRVIFRLSLSIGGYEIPMFVNMIAFVVALALSVWMFRSGK